MELNVFAITEGAPVKCNAKRQDAYLLRTTKKISKGYGTSSKDGVCIKDEPLFVAMFDGETSDIAMEILTRRNWGESVEKSIRRLPSSILENTAVSVGFINPTGIATFMNVGTGNSCIYLLRDGKAEQLTKRTSYVGFRTGDVVVMLTDGMEEVLHRHILKAGKFKDSLKKATYLYRQMDVMLQRRELVDDGTAIIVY